MTTAPTIVDLSRLPKPDAIIPPSAAELLADATARFLAEWERQREIDPTLEAYDVQSIASDPAGVAFRVLAFLRLGDLGRVNDAVRALLAPLSRGADLDNLVARQGILRRVVVPANTAEGTTAVMESDFALLRRYLFSFERGSAGSAGRYLYEAWTAWPAGIDTDGNPVGMGDARVVGRAVHGRRGDTDVVISGPGGRDPTDAELARVRAAVLVPDVVPEAVAVAVMRAKRVTYRVDLVAELPQGPDGRLVAAEAAARVRTATTERTIIGGEIPAGFLAGSAYGPSVVRIDDRAPVAIAADPYTVPVCLGVSVVPETRP